MTISRVNGLGWSIGDKLTSAQINAIDIALTTALHKSAGSSDTLASIVSASGAGRLAITRTAGANTDTTYALSSGISIIDATSGLTATRTYTLSNTAAVTGDRVRVLGGAQDVIVKDASANTLMTVGTSPTGSAESKWGEFYFNGTAWILFRGIHLPPGSSSVWTAARGEIKSIRTELQTAATTQTNCGTLTVTDDTTVSFAARVTCTLRGTNTSRGTWTFSGQVARSAAGIAVLDSLSTGLAVSVSTAGSVTMDVDGANALRIRVTPGSSAGRNWMSELHYQMVTDA